ncbi:major facilitator superfamily domain-containing protein [Pseudomassariella vexata]|uniref:Major facilitator superfamily domain-containing protein n=1 Tax=Pseudomassariella vexata TaxID=1141098 RepID=A0A1Y2DHC3_9PEZI|nr:major facilitator superfamily domain-containing protein [Pseudomassariella vexata]ORY58135.1 major facilitator superfamily domain-containing protein [Pseudomassariella vexata]
MSFRGSTDKDGLDGVYHKPADHVESLTTVVEIDNIRVLGITPEDAEFYINYPEERRRRVVHKVDIRLIPMLAALYLMAHIDRANIGNAKIEGLITDLGMTSVQYNIVLSIFFIPYVLLEVPSNILLKKFKRPSLYLALLVIPWGIVMTCTGLVQNFAGLMVTRILLGIFEAGFFPGAIYLCSYWYMPKDLATRISYFYCASALSGAFSGLLAAAIAQMDGVGGLEGWRWIFLLEGLVTVVIGISCIFLLIDSPTLSGRWLKPDEIRYLELQMFIKQGGKFSDEKESFKWKDLKAVLLNWRVYLQAYFLMCQSATSYGTKFTLPTITKSMGFSSTNAQLMSAPPYVAGALSAILLARLSDRYYWRMPFVAGPLVLVVISYSIIISLNGDLADNKGPAYFALILTCMGIYPIQPAAASWNANNLAPAVRRNIGVALNNCVGNTGGIIGSFMYIESEAPSYPTGFGLSLAFGASGMLVAFFLEMSYKWSNKRKARLSEDEVRARHTEDELLDMGDKSPLFKYVL